MHRQLHSLHFGRKFLLLNEAVRAFGNRLDGGPFIGSTGPQNIFPGACGGADDIEVDHTPVIQLNYENGGLKRGNKAGSSSAQGRNHAR